MGMPRIKYIIDINEENKAGLYYSVLERVSRVNEDKVVYNLSFYDGKVISIFKNVFRIKPKKKKKNFSYKGMEITSLHIKRNIIDYVFILFGLSNIVRLLDAKRLAKNYKINNSDVVFAHWGVSSGIIGYYLKKAIECKLIICCHGSDVHSIPLKRNDIKKCLLKAFKYSDMNIFVSKALLNSARDLGYYGSNFSVIYNGVDEQYCNDISEQMVADFFSKYKISTCKSYLKIGFIGNLKSVKGADLLPQITRAIIGQNKNTQFVIAGDGELKDKIVRYCENTSFIGHIDKHEVPVLLSGIDILILPSRNEGLPLIIAEAKKCGVSVVAADVGGVSELLEKEYCIPLGDSFVDEFSSKVVEVSNSLSGMVSTGLDNRFLWSKIAQKELEIITNVNNKI